MYFVAKWCVSVLFSAFRFEIREGHTDMKMEIV